jgi:putative ABC transport system permease protein
MLNNYLKIAVRNLWKNKIFSLINIFGLSLSISFCLLLFFYIRHEQSYDDFHIKKDRLFRLEMTNVWTMGEPQKESRLFSFLTKNDDVVNSVVFPLIVGPDLQNTFPEIKSITRFKNQGHHFGVPLVRVEQQVYKQPDVIFADENFFSNFSFELVQGNPQKVLNDPSHIVITENTAKKFFGKENPIGKGIEIIGEENSIFTVSGIVKDPPALSSIPFTMILPLRADSRYKENIDQRFNHAEHVFMIELGNGVSATEFEKKLNLWKNSYFADYMKEFKDFKDVNSSNYHWFLRPLTKCHYNAAYDWGHYTDAKNIYQLASLAIIILLIASLNYVLLTISNASARSQEIGVRKLMGAGRKLVMLQFWIETQIVVAIAVVLGLVLSSALLPLFNQVIGAELHMTDFGWNEILPAVVLLCILLGLIAGYYPAMILSGMKSVSVIRNIRTFKINPVVSRILVIVQYTACVVFMISAFIIRQQMQFISNKDLGFDKDQILVVSNPTFDQNFTRNVKERLSDYAKSQSAIQYFSAMNGSLDGSGNKNGFKLNGDQQYRFQLTVDYDYFDMMGLKIIKGRAFSRSFPSDTIRQLRTAVINESLFTLLGKSAKIGEFNEALGETIIGVVKDYHFNSLSNKIEPEDHVLVRGFAMNFMFKIKGGHMQEMISRIEKEWKSITGNYPFEYTFLDQTIAKMYEPQARWQKTVEASCIFAIFIACMGLFGLSAINASNRTKEIGIRKVLGANVSDIVGSLSKNFLLLIIVAIVVAMPMAWFLMNRWLDDFAYRVQIHWSTFALAALISLAVAFLAVSIKALKAAVINPVTSLRNE